MTVKLFWHFLLHLLVAALLFIAVACVAIFLWYLTDLMKQYGVPSTIHLSLFYVSEGLFFLDLGSFIFVVLVEVAKFVRNVWKGAFGENHEA